MRLGIRKSKTDTSTTNGEFIDPIDAIGDFEDEPEFDASASASASQTAATTRRDQEDRVLPTILEADLPLHVSAVINTVRVLADTLAEVVRIRHRMMR